MNPELRDRIKNVIDTEPVTLFMKGTPQFVMCGNSERALQALRGCRRAGHDGGRPARPRDPAGAVGALRLADDPAGLHRRRARRRRRHRAGARARPASSSRSSASRSARATATTPTERVVSVLVPRRSLGPGSRAMARRPGPVLAPLASNRAHQGRRSSRHPIPPGLRSGTRRTSVRRRRSSPARRARTTSHFTSRISSRGSNGSTSAMSTTSRAGAALGPSTSAIPRRTSPS